MDCPQYGEFEEFIDIAVMKLHDSRFEKNITLHQRRMMCEEAVELLEKYSIDNIQYNIRVLVKYPDLLKRFLHIKDVALDKSDISPMLSRCVEQSLMESCVILIKFIKEKYPEYSFDLKLTPGPYKLNEQVYEYCKANGYNDPYYDGKMKEYTCQDMIDKGQTKYTGYRDAYHLLLYGGKRKQEIIEWIDRFCYFCKKKPKVDCVVEAACDYYGIDRIGDNSPKEVSDILDEIRKCVNDDIA